MTTWSVTSEEYTRSFEGLRSDTNKTRGNSALPWSIYSHTLGSELHCAGLPLDPPLWKIRCQPGRGADAGVLILGTKAAPELAFYFSARRVEKGIPHSVAHLLDYRVCGCSLRGSAWFAGLRYHKFTVLRTILRQNGELMVQVIVVWETESSGEYLACWFMEFTGDFTVYSLHVLRARLVLLQ